MTEKLRDLALELYIQHGATPDDITDDGSIVICTKAKGVHKTFKFAPLRFITMDDVYKYEISH